MTNLEKLQQVGLLEPDKVSQEHKDIINNELTDDEVSALISSNQKLGGKGSMHGGKIVPTFF